MNERAIPPETNRPRIRLRVATKLLIAFLIISLISFGTVGFFSVFSMGQLRNIAIDNSVSLGETAAADSSAALAALGESAIRQKALDVSEQVKIYLAAHPGLSSEALGSMPDLVRIGVQPVGDTGYTCVYEKDTAVMRLHPNAKMINYDMGNLKETLPSWWKIYEPSLNGSISGGYYDWQEPDGNIRQKFMYMVPIEGTQYMVAATTYIDEFQKPVEATRLTIAAETRKTADTIDEQNRRAITIFLAIFAALLIIIAVLVFVLSRMITDPIRKLTQGAAEIGSGNLDYQVSVHSGDELEQLADTFNRMAGDLKRYMNEILVTNAEKERLENEMEIARAIQQSFLPETISQVEGFDVAAKSIMAKEVGGDFFDVIPFEVVRIKPGRMGVLIADVSGKGIPAALFMALSRIVVRVNATWFCDEPARAIHDANNIIAADSKAGMFVTLFYGILDHTRHTFTYVNAGHNPPIVYHGSDGTFSELAATGIAMGVITDAEYTANEQPLSPGDVVVLYTDGITEAMNAREDMFGEERLYEVIRHVNGLNAGEILTNILNAVKEFTADYPQSDDITLMVVRVV